MEYTSLQINKDGKVPFDTESSLPQDVLRIAALSDFAEENSDVVQYFQRLLHRAMDSTVRPAQLHTFFQDWKAKRKHMKILVIGDCGSGKTTLVNNLLGEDIAKEHSLSVLSTSQGVVQGVQVTVHETSGLENPDAEGNAEYKNEMRSLLSGGKVDVIVFCFKATETRMRDSLIRSFQEYHNMGLNWRKTVIALTFADAVPTPRAVRQQRSYDPARYFNARVAELKQTIIQTLNKRIHVPIEMVENLKVAPTTGDLGEELPNNERWFESMWSLVLDAIKTVPTNRTQGDIMLEQPRPRSTPDRAGMRPSGYQQSPYRTPPERSEGFSSRDALLTGNEASCSIECVCLHFKAAFIDCIMACYKAFACVCKFMYNACCRCDS